MSDILTREDLENRLENIAYFATRTTCKLTDAGMFERTQAILTHDAALRAVIQQVVEDVEKLPHAPLCDSWDRIEHENRPCDCGHDAAIANLKKGLGDGMVTLTELADRLEAWGLIDAVGDKYRPELQAIAAELRSLEAQPQSVNGAQGMHNAHKETEKAAAPVNQQMLDALRELHGLAKHRGIYTTRHERRNAELIAAAESAPAQPDVASRLLEALTAVRPSCRAPGCWCEASNGFHIDGVIIPHTKACITVRMAIAVYEAQIKAEPKA